MKQLIVIFAMMFALPGFAAQSCPDLSGSFLCRYKVAVFTVGISQSESGNHTKYIVDGAPIIADGREHAGTKLPAMMAKYVDDVRYTATCNGNLLDYTGTATMKKSRELATVKGSLKRLKSGKVIIDLKFQTKSNRKHVKASCHRVSK